MHFQQRRDKVATISEIGNAGTQGLIADESEVERISEETIHSKMHQSGQGLRTWKKAEGDGTFKVKRRKGCAAGTRTIVL